MESSASESKPFQTRPNAEIQTSNANLKYENLTSSFGRLRQTFAPKGVPHVHHDFFPHSTNHIIALGPCRCRYQF